jgi:hypothetical protein
MTSVVMTLGRFYDDKMKAVSKNTKKYDVPF